MRGRARVLSLVPRLSPALYPTVYRLSPNGCSILEAQFTEAPIGFAKSVTFSPFNRHNGIVSPNRFYSVVKSIHARSTEAYVRRFSDWYQESKSA